MNTSNKTRKSACWMLALCLAASPTMIFANSENGNEPDKILNFKVLQNTSMDNCMYMGEVALEVEYALKSVDFKDIVFKGTDGAGVYSEIDRRTVEYGNGTLVLVFNAGDCLTTLDIEME